MTPVAPDTLFRALGDPTRLALFERLCRDGDQTVVALTRHAGVSQPAVSKHLAVLKRAGLVHDRPVGRTVRYGARAQGLSPMLDWAGDMAGFWEARFDDLGEVLDRMEP